MSLRPRSNTYPQSTSLHRLSIAYAMYSYPAGRMPRDVWEDIFLHCLPVPSMQHCTTSTAPLLLLQVCRAWRRVALSLPHLWTSLSVAVRNGQASPPLNVASEWLQRSGDLPLQLSLSQSNESDGNQEAADAVLALYMRYLRRWKDVRLDVANPTYGKSLQPSAHLYAPLLETFHLLTLHRMTPNDEIMQDLLRMLEVAPRLSNFSVTRLSDLDVSPTTTVAIPWTQLTCLDLGFIPSVSACLSLMSGCPKLESCNLLVDENQGPLPAVPIVLPALTSIELHIRSTELAALLDRAIFPALKSMVLYVQNADDSQVFWPQTSFMDFLGRSKCTLTRLNVYDTGVLPSQFIECLEHESVRGITELVVHDNRDWTWDPIITPKLVKLLTVDGGEILLPSLRKLDLGRGCWTCPDGLLSDMIESRWRTKKAGVARLEHVHVDMHLLWDTNGPDRKKLQRLRQEGMKVRIGFYHD
ncbi:hypothetical protein FB45DRAFT_189955 [Roridomyces roridus]|uniref:F-box domain-containing protein n=1 Tax=Roridomyces roridus TaxID=1738132 RepID=A0AAD7CEX3_9AGAR|nr:hypothetical protein FB45DRAFT_189955 [Roridomyces roridus]